MKTLNINWELYRENFQYYSENGLTYSEVRKELLDKYGISISDQTVLTVMKKLGIKYKFSKTHREWLDSEIEELRIYLNNKLSFKEIEEKFEGRHTLQSIKGIIKNRGSELNLKYLGNKRFQFTDSFIKIVKKEMEEDLSVTFGSISIKYNIDSSHLRKAFIRVFGQKEYELYKGLRNSFKISKEELEYNVNVLNLTEKEIAKKFNTTKDVIAHRKQILGVRKKEKEISEVNLKEKYGRKYEIVKKFLGKDPMEEDLKKRYDNLFTREYLLPFFEKYNYSSKEVAKELGLSLSLIDSFKRKFNIKSPKKPRLKDFSKEFYYKCFVTEEMSYEDISSITGLSSESTRKYIHRIFSDDELVTKRTAGERIVLRALRSFGDIIEYTLQDTHKDVAPDYRERVLIDFKVIHDNKVYWIEYNGEQHYNFDFYQTLGKKRLGKDKFISLLNRDRCVRTYAKQNNITLIEIPYSVKTTNRVIEILTEIILNNKNPEDVINLTKVFSKIRSYGVDPIDNITLEKENNKH